jgi:hypothetical protein
VLDQVAFPVYARWVTSLPAPLAAEVENGIAYLREHGRGAVLPLVRHRIQTSRYYPDMSEIRVNGVVGDRRYVLRVLTCFVRSDQAVLICVAGDKHTYEERTGHDWYDDYVPVADEIVTRYLRRKNNE